MPFAVPLSSTRHFKDPKTHYNFKRN
jgi:hypothetical protein